MSNISVDYDVLNQRGSPAWFTDTFANIPTAGFVGRMFISKDTFAFYRDTGTGWDLIGGPGIGTLTGSGVVGQVSFFNGTQVLAGNNNLFWDNTNGRLGIGTATPSAPLDIHATGTNATFNGTSTNNAYLVFQNAGTSKWRIGNTYNAGANSYDIYNNFLASTTLSINGSTNALTINGNTDINTILNTKQLSVYGDVSNAGVIQLKQLGSISVNSGYVGLASFTANTFGVYFPVANTSIIFNNALLTANRTYTFPDATGTIALTSDLTGYVTLATTQTITGAKTFNDYQIFTNAISANSGIAFLNGVMPPITSSNYSGIGGNSQGVSIVTRPVSTNFTNNLYFPSASNSYTFPNATGTLALTSDLNSYLPLTGGTLTGALVINPTNTLTIGLDVASNTTRFRSDNTEGFKRQLEIVMGSGTLVQLTAKGYLANYGTDMAFYTATTSGVNASPGIYITGTNNRVGIKTGTPSFDLDVTGELRSTTSAYFATTSGQVGIGTSVVDSTISVDIQNNSATSNNVFLRIKNNVGSEDTGIKIAGTFGTAYEHTFGVNTIINSGDLIFHNSNSLGYRWYVDGNERMRITSGGNVLIGSTTDAGYKLLVSGTTSTGSIFLNAPADGFAQNLIGAARFGNVSSASVDLASVFPSNSFTSRGISVMLQIVSASATSNTLSCIWNLVRTITGVWTSSAINQITNGTTITSVTGSGTTITINFSAGAQYGSVNVYVSTYQ